MSTVQKFSKVIIKSPLIQTGAYTAGQVVGGLLELPQSVESYSGVTEIINIGVADAANQKSALSFYFFSSKPTGTYTDGAAWNPSQADLNKIGALISVPTANYQSGSGQAFGDIGNVRKKVQATAATDQLSPASKSKSLWMVVVTTGTPTYGASGALQFSIGLDMEG